MNRDVFLVGTNHKYQHNSSLYEKVCPDSINKFKQYILSIYRDKKIQAIGEEMHRSDLMKDRDKSVPEEVALKLGIPHKYCSPSDEESVKLGWKPTLVQKRGETEAEFDERDWGNDKIKEQGWLQNILEFDKWPLLFICGSKHIESFSNLLSVSSINIHIVNKNWEHKKR